MKHTRLMLCLAGACASTMLACDDGTYNNLACDPEVYQAECLNSTNAMNCTNGMLNVLNCGEGKHCQTDVEANVATCVQNM